MRKIMASMAFLAVAGTLAIAAPPQERDDHRDREDRRDNGKHRGSDQHENRGGDGDRHDNGNHRGGDKHRDHEDYQGWDDDHDRIRPGRLYPYGRYGHVR